MISKVIFIIATTLHLGISEQVYTEPFIHTSEEACMAKLTSDMYMYKSQPNFTANIKDNDLVVYHYGKKYNTHSCVGYKQFK